MTMLLNEGMESSCGWSIREGEYGLIMEWFEYRNGELRKGERSLSRPSRGWARHERRRKSLSERI
jgi:hypothetical protein